MYSSRRKRMVGNARFSITLLLPKEQITALCVHAHGHAQSINRHPPECPLQCEIPKY